MNDKLNGSSLNRRDFVKGAAAASVGALALAALPGCEPKKAPTSASTPSQPQAKKLDFDGESLRIFIYSGAWEKVFRDTFIPLLKRETGAEAILDPGWWDSIPKLKASPKGQPAFDLVLTDATQGYPAIREGLFAKLDLAKLPNHKNYAPSVLKNWVFEEGYGLPHPDSVMTLAYRKDAVSSAPTSWAALAQDAYAGQLGLYNSFYMSLYTFAAIKVAAEGRPGSAHEEIAKNLDGVFEYASSLRERVAHWWPTSTDMAFSLQQKNCRIGNMHSTDMLPVMREDKTLSAVVPQDDRAFVQLMWVIPAETKKAELAHRAIDLIAGVEMQGELARRGSVTPILSVAQEVAKADPVWASIYPSTEEALAKIAYYPYEAYFKDWNAIVERWDSTILRKKG